MQFAERSDLTAQGTSAPGLFDFTRDDLVNWAQLAVTLIIALALVFFVMRPLLKRVLAPETGAPLALPPSAEILPPGQQHAASVEPGAFPPALPGEAPPAGAENQQPAWISAAKTMGAAQVATLKSVGGLVQENPKQAALIVRDWLSSAA